MKTINRFLVVIAVSLLLCNTAVFAQDSPQKPEFVTVTTMHWNMDNEDFKMDEWKAVEKEFLDKVTKKNEHVLGASFYLHYMTPDNTELIYVQSFASWEAIGLSSDRNGELIEEGWPDEEARKAYFKKRSNYYSDFHSDEIYATMSNAKPFVEDPTEDMICYVRRSHFAFPEDGTQEEFSATFKEYTENVTHKNEYIKAYFPNAHAWGSDRTEFVEAYFVDSLADLDKMFDRDDELFNEHWSDEAAKKEMDEKGGKYFTGVHGDYVYTYVAGLNK